MYYDPNIDFQVILDFKIKLSPQREDSEKALVRTVGTFTRELVKLIDVLHNVMGY